MNYATAKILAMIRSSLFRIVNKEFLTFLVFLAMSTGFWFVMALNETYEREIAIPLRITNVPENVIITDGLPDSVHVTVKDKGYSLLSIFYGDMIDDIQLPFASYARNNTGKGSVTLAELQKQIYPMLYLSTKIISIKADKLDFYYNYGLSKRVPVLFDGQVNAAEQYYLARTQFNPDSITVYASQTQLDSIKEVFITPITVDELRDTVSREVTLKKIRGVKMEPSRVKVTLYADLLTETTVNVPVTPVNVPAGYILRTFPSSVNVRVVVGRNRLSSVTPSNFRIVADYHEVANKPSSKCHLSLRIMPKGVNGVFLEYKTVDYLIEKVE